MTYYLFQGEKPFISTKISRTLEIPWTKNEHNKDNFINSNTNWTTLFMVQTANQDKIEMITALCNKIACKTTEEFQRNEQIIDKQS
jgi:hypothetical protein